MGLPVTTLHGAVLGGNLLPVSVLSLCKRTLSRDRTAKTGEKSTMERGAMVGRTTGAFPELQRMLVWNKKCMFVL